MTLSETTPSGEGNQRVLLAGASGYIGRAVARELVRRGVDVVALARQPGFETAGCRVVVAEVADQASLSQALADTPVDAVVSCIASRGGVAGRVDYHANRNLLNVAAAAGANRFLLLSAICVQPPRLAFQHAKLAFEAELARIGHYYATESMLVWDEREGAYSAAATPETGRETLRDHYARVLKEGLSGHELGEQKLF